MNNNLLHQIALTLVPNIGAVQARILVTHFEDATAIFKAKKNVLDKLEGIGEVRSSGIRKFTDFKRAEEEMAFIEKYKISPLFLTDDAYPKRLLNCYDPPALLYYRGQANLNAAKIIAVVGTRSKTDYGKQLTEKLAADLEDQQILLVSGLALGVDAIAHKAALKHKIPTVAVMANGLDKIYPAEHTLLAKDIIKENGGLLTEFRSKTKPDKHNFPSRNRIVAGMSDATIVIETDIKGGSMITAELANGYNKDVFAFPGRTTDNKSAGCNYLIKNNKAILLTGAQDLIDILGWAEKKSSPKKAQKELFIQLSDEEKIIVGLLKEKETVAIDELRMKSNLNSSMVAAAILNLELQNVITSLPGKRYRLL
ncbi:MAG TPA: DNA-processing protein DprA [Chitinophagaceae bacterium]|nr:DNA-processing protein DprA [Chitinophagaceae bacterium]